MPLSVDVAVRPCGSRRPLWAVFRLALRQTEGLTNSLITLLGLDQTVPDSQHPQPAGRDAGATEAPI